jgi:hypothetical protein
MATSPLKTDPKYGYFPRWPEDGDGWIHPEDVALARAMIPSQRIFRREGADGNYGLLRYGETILRVLPALWQEVSPEGFEIGDWVEVMPRGMTNEPRTGFIREMFWDERDRSIRYQIVEIDQPVEQLYAREDLKRVDQIA